MHGTTPQPFQSLTYYRQLITTDRSWRSMANLINKDWGIFLIIAGNDSWYYYKLKGSLNDV